MIQTFLKVADRVVDAVIGFSNDLIGEPAPKNEVDSDLFGWWRPIGLALGLLIVFDDLITAVWRLFF